MKASIVKEYEYTYFWVNFKSRVVIAELRTEADAKYKRFYIPGEVCGVLEEDVKILEPIADYNEVVAE